MELGWWLMKAAPQGGLVVGTMANPARLGSAPIGERVEAGMARAET